MRSLIKFPLLALLCVLSAEVLLSTPAMAGSRGVTQPDSSSAGVESNFGSSETAGGTPSSEITSGRVFTGLLNSLRTIQQSGSVRSVQGRDLPISPQQIANIQAALIGSASGNNAAPLDGIRQQLAAETGLGLDITPLGNSPQDLITAITSINVLINSLSGEQLLAAAESPTFNVLLQMLQDAKEALNDSDSDSRLEGSTGGAGLVKVTLAPNAPAAGTPPASQPIQAQP